jgi:hypothetical protein
MNYITERIKSKLFIYLLITVVVIALLYYYNNQTENMTNNYISIYDVIRPNQLVKFVYRDSEGKKYYMSIMPNSVCKNTQQQCVSNILVLIDENTVNNQVNEYIDIINDNEKICNFKKTLYANKTASEENKKLYTEFADCKTRKQFTTDFLVIQKKIGDIYKYTFKGVNEGINIKDTSGGNYYINSDAKNNLCADISDILNDSINADMNLKVSNGVLQIEISFGGSTLYIGKCDNLICESHDNKYVQLCLYNKGHPNIINLEPVLQNYS